MAATKKTKPKAKGAGSDDAAEVLKRMKQKQAESPDDCPFC